MSFRAFIAVISFIFALGVGVVASASASELQSTAATHPAELHVSSQAKPGLVRAGVVQPLGPPSGSCNTSFNPSAPQGAPMHQYYWNCNASVQLLCPAHIIQGVYHIDWNADIAVDFNEWVDWYWPVTEPGTTYTTVFCDGNASEDVTGPAGPCYTSFSPEAPNGARMTQSYKNCSVGAVDVKPAFWYQGSLHVSWATQCLFGCINDSVASGAIIHWLWPSTVPGASYTTVFTDENTVTSAQIH